MPKRLGGELKNRVGERTLGAKCSARKIAATGAKHQYCQHLEALKTTPGTYAVKSTSVTTANGDKLKMPSCAEFDFTLILSGVSDFSDDDIDSLCAAGCDDATTSRRYGRVYITFSRQASSMGSAIISAIEDVKKANIGANVQRVDTCNLVTQAEIGRRIDRSRQSVALYIAGERGPGSFPAPACNITDGQPLWYWCEVTYWLYQNDLIKESENRETQEIAAINTLLELEHLKLIAPKITKKNARKIHDLQRASRKKTALGSVIQRGHVYLKCLCWHRLYWHHC